jgi:hypothetical protein
MEFAMVVPIRRDLHATNYAIRINLLAANYGNRPPVCWASDEDSINDASASDQFLSNLGALAPATHAARHKKTGGQPAARSGNRQPD